MATKEQRSAKEKKKAKSDKDKPKQMSAYKAAISGGGTPTININPLNKKT